MTRFVFAAIASTVLFSGTVGVLIAVAGFGLLRIGEQMLEAVGLIPMRWGEQNVFLMMEISGVASLPVIVWFAWWFYRQAIAGERRLVGYKYSPPDTDSDL
ncbi:MAG: hypothetical protein RLN70_05145 [Rhodospirillaceae bacterium]